MLRDVDEAQRFTFGLDSFISNFKSVLLLLEKLGRASLSNYCQELLSHAVKCITPELEPF